MLRKMGMGRLMVDFVDFCSQFFFFKFSVDGSYLLTCGSDKKLKLWNPLTGLLLKTYGGHANEVTDAVGSCDRYFNLKYRKQK